MIAHKGVKVSERVRDSFWLQDMMAGFPAAKLTWSMQIYSRSSSR